VELTTTHPDVEILQSTATYPEVRPHLAGGTLVDEDGTDDPFVIRLQGSPSPNETAVFDLSITGTGWVPDDAYCDSRGFESRLSVPLNRDLGFPLLSYSFEDGTTQGFDSEAAHGTGDLDECSSSTYSNGWQGASTDRAHSGQYSLRYGNGNNYGTYEDGGLFTPPLNVPSGGGALGFYLWMETHPLTERLTGDGLVIEVRPVGETIWEYLPRVNYNINLDSQGCGLQGDGRFPFGVAALVDLLGGDGEGDVIEGDTFDRQYIADLAAYAGQQVQVRFRFGADQWAPSTGSAGVYLDTVSFHGPFIIDTWSAAAPTNLQGSDAQCPVSFDLTWDAVAGASNYNIYRSETSCTDANQSNTLYDTASGTTYSDPAAIGGVQYYYAVAAADPVAGCSAERSCIPGACPSCAPPPVPTGLLVDKSGSDAVLTWDDPGGAMTWNVYREIFPNRSSWTSPLAPGVTDGDIGTPGIQYTDVDALSDPDSYFYLVTAMTNCGESAL
jgi:hypothetical protein